jgi:membrane-associated phospholipid phosphatase
MQQETTTMELVRTAGVGRRRVLLAGGLTGVAAVLAATPGTAHADGDHRGRPGGIEPDAGLWRTFVLSRPDEFAVPPPPTGKAAKQDMDAVLHAAAHRDAAALDSIAYWNTGSPAYRWNQTAAQLMTADPSPDTFRVMLYISLAVYDATIATWSAKQKYRRKRPGQHGNSLATAIATPDSPSYPSEHGAAAGAAVGVLTHLFPTAAADLEARAAEHAAARVAAGVEYPSDFAAGLALGRQVAAKVISDRITGDGFGAPYPGDPDAPYRGGDESFPVLPKDDGFNLMIGKWRPVVVGDVTRFRPPAPPTKGSPERAAELAEVKNFARRKTQTFSELFFWAQDPAGRPPAGTGFVNTTSAAFYYAVDVAFIALDELNQKVLEYRLDANPPRAARAYALTYTALQDAYIACWNAKYHYLVGRPIHFDPTIDTLWETYQLASYPSGHSCNMSSTATMLGYLFPRDADYFLSRAKENAASRFWAGIHFTSDYVEGVKMGQAVGRAVIEYAKADGS